MRVKKLGTMTVGELDRLVEDAPEGAEYELVDGTPLLMGNPERHLLGHPFLKKTLVF